MGDMSKIERPLSPVERAAIGYGEQPGRRMFDALADGMADEAKRQADERKAHRSALAEAMKDNIEGEVPASLGDRLRDAENLWRYFCRRDEMNAETHLKEPHICQCGHAHTGSTDGEDVGCPTCRDDHDWEPGTKVRYSPITVASERVAGYLARLFYGRDVDYMTAQVKTGGAGVNVASLHFRLDAQTEALQAADDLRRSLDRVSHPDPTLSPFDVPGPETVLLAAQAYDAAARRLRAGQDAHPDEREVESAGR